MIPNTSLKKRHFDPFEENWTDRGGGFWNIGTHRGRALGILGHIGVGGFRGGVENLDTFW